MAARWRLLAWRSIRRDGLPLADLPADLPIGVKGQGFLRHQGDDG